MIRVEWSEADGRCGVAEFPDSELQSVLDRCHARYGKAGEVLAIPEVLPKPKQTQQVKRGRR